MPDRYEGRPFLKLVDSFVLDCMGELDASQAFLLDQMLPTLQSTFDRRDSWQEIVMAQLQFGPDIRLAIQELWVKNQEIAKHHGRTLEPMAFVEMFVDANVLRSE